MTRSYWIQIEGVLNSIIDHESKLLKADIEALETANCTVEQYYIAMQAGYLYHKGSHLGLQQLLSLDQQRHQLHLQ